MNRRFEDYRYVEYKPVLRRHHILNEKFIKEEVIGPFFLKRDI